MRYFACLPLSIVATQSSFVVIDGHLRCTSQFSSQHKCLDHSKNPLLALKKRTALYQEQTVGPILSYFPGKREVQGFISSTAAGGIRVL